MEELENNKKPAQQELGGKELYELRKKQKEETGGRERRKEQLSKTPKKIGKYLLYAIGGIVIIGGIGWFLSSRPNLPPTTIENHSEDSPPAHILTEPISDRIQRHMLEHADGGGRPGILIQYNCRSFECEPDLIEQLTDLVRQYPDNVYLAPNNYDGKIILTKEGRREILDSFDEEAIGNFIER